MSPSARSSASRALQPERGAGAALMQIYDAPSLELWGRGWGLLLGRCGEASPPFGQCPPTPVCHFWQECVCVWRMEVHGNVVDLLGTMAEESAVWEFTCNDCRHNNQN